MTYTVLMHGITGDFRTECDTLEEATKLRDNHRGLGWESEIEFPTIHLQGCGNQRAIPVEDLKPGMITMWNWGYTHEIMGVVPSKSGKTFQIQYTDGHLDSRKMRKGRLVAIA